MSQNDFNLANQGFPSMRSDMNSAFQALASNSSGTSAPGTTYAYQFWYDETNDLLKMRNADNDAWIELASFDQTADEWQIRPSGSNIPSAGSFSNRNKIINGNFDIWQRGIYFTSGYAADRWRLERSGSTVIATRGGFALGQTDVPNEPTYFQRVAVTSVSGASNYALIEHRLEGVRTFAGQTVTLSFWAKADSSKNMAVEFTQFFGTGGSPSSGVLGVGVTTCALTTSWQKFTVTATMPSISGKTIGTNNDDFLGVRFWFDGGSNYNGSTNSLGQQSGTFDIAQVQLEAGDVVTPFEMRTYGQELALCRRYYLPNIFNGRNLGPLVPGGSTVRVADVFFPVEMRVAPTVTANGTNIGALTPQFFGKHSISLTGNPSSNIQCNINGFTADAEL